MKRFCVILGLCVLCFLPAVVVGFANGGTVTVDSLLHPFKAESFPQTSGAAYTTKNEKSVVLLAQRFEATSLSDQVIEMPEIFVVGSWQSKVTMPEVETNSDTEAEENDGSSCWVQDSKVGGTVRICGFQPNE